MELIHRTVSPEVAELARHVHPVLARVLAARGVRRPEDLDYGLGGLLPPYGPATEKSIRMQVKK